MLSRTARHWSGATQGILLMLLSTFASAAMSAASKMLVIDYSTAQILFFRCAFAAIFAAAWARYHRWSISLVSAHWMEHIFRGIVSIVSLVCYVWPMAYLPLSDVVALTFTQPLFATALSIPMLRERVSRRTWVAVVAGFCGMLIVLRPGLVGQQLLMQLIAVFGAFLWALSVILTRRLTATESSTKIVLYILLTGAATTGGVLPFQWRSPKAFDLALLCVVAIAGVCSQFFTTEAYRRAKASVVSPYVYATLIWTTAIGYVIWGEVPDIYVVTGSAILFCSGIYLAVQTQPHDAGTIPASGPTKYLLDDAQPQRQRYSQSS